MAYELGLERLEQAVQRLDSANGSACERLAAVREDLSPLGKEIAVTAGILTELADFHRRLPSREAFQALSDADCQLEIERIRRWTEHLRTVVEGAAVGDSGPAALEQGAS